MYSRVLLFIKKRTTSLQGKKSNFSFIDIVAFLLVIPSMAVFMLGFVCTIANVTPGKDKLKVECLEKAGF